jgi:ribosome biogenesis GTPase / thiamine phosphate phosphatase
MIDLRTYGFDSIFEEHFKSYNGQDLEPARICAEYKEMYRIITQHGDLQAVVSGKFRFNAVGTGDFPAVGDWVAADLRPQEGNATIHAVLPRKSKFSRKTAGSRMDEQIVAANFDYVFIMTSLNLDLNIRRIERYLTAAWESGGLPVIILTKSDLCDEGSETGYKIAEMAAGISVHAVSAYTGEGLDEIDKYFTYGKTMAFIGSSGVGKSTLLNRYAGSEIMHVNSIREDDSKGRHTTAHRQLVMLPSGSMIIDTPGMRELSMWEVGDGLGEVFTDVEEYFARCRFSDCKHQSEPGCAVKEAIMNGELSEKRWKNYLKLKLEAKHADAKVEFIRIQTERYKNIAKMSRSYKKNGSIRW